MSQNQIKKKILVTIPSDLYEKIRELAIKRGLTVNAMILVLLHDEIESRGM